MSSFVGPSGPRCHLPEHSSDDETLGSDTYVVECRVLFKLSMPRQGQDRAGSLSSIRRVPQIDGAQRWLCFCGAQYVVESIIKCQLSKQGGYDSQV